LIDERPIAMRRSAAALGGGPARPSETSKLVIKPLGSGQEVGRSCHLVEFKGKRILLDMGIHPGKRGLQALPFLDEAGDLATIDLLLISHFHLDHVASLPYLMQKTRFRGRVFMTHPTWAITRLLLSDYVRVSGVQANSDTEGLYDDKDVFACLQKCEKIDFHQQIEVDGIRFTAYNAGHVLGACQFLIEIAGVRILYTGDFSREDDRHLMGAECNPDWRPDVLIVESTFGVQVHETQRERERQFIEAIDRITRRGGKCLIPVFSLGRAQELLLILEEHWSKTPEIQQIPIYHASRLATRSLSIYRGFINSMNDRMKRLNDISNPWALQYISNLENPQDFDEPGPAVVLASPGMLQNGTSRKLFEQWCSDPRNGVIIAGYCVEGTLAKEILLQPKEITSLSGRRLPLTCEVKYVSFTAHSDFPGTYSYIKQLLPRHTVLVHGERSEMQRLHDELRRKFSSEEMDFFMPGNGVRVEFDFHEERMVKMLGRLADKRVRVQNAPVFGFLVSGGFDDKLVAPDELQDFTPLSTTVLAQRLHLPFHSRFERLKMFVGKMFEVEVVVDVPTGSTNFSGAASSVSQGSTIQRNSLKVLDEILLTHSYPPGEVLMEWRASPANDMIADAIVALLMQAEGGVSGVRISSCVHHHHHHADHKHGEQEELPEADSVAGAGAHQHDHESSHVVVEGNDDLRSDDGADDDVLDEANGARSNEQVATLVKLILEERYGAGCMRVTKSESTSRLQLDLEDGSRHFISVESLSCESSDVDVKRDLERCILNAKRALLPIGLQLRDTAMEEDEHASRTAVDDDEDVVTAVGAPEGMGANVHTTG